MPTRSIPRAAHSSQLSDFEVEQALLTGEHASALEVQFGEQQYRELRDLARKAGARGRARGGPRVLILPGIMGSTIGTAGGAVLWIDPFGVARGKLAELALHGKPAHVALGVLLPVYLKLKLTLRIEGLDADFYPYDWRLGIDEVGRALHDSLGDGRESYLVAHSMGGLVGRTALALDAKQKRIKRLIMLGTPNHGSFAAVQALRGTYPLVRRVAGLDLVHKAEQLTRDVFHTFPGLYQLLPSPAKFGAVDLYDAADWPDGLRPRQELLDGVAPARKRLGGPDDRLVLIAGVDQTTTTGMSSQDGEFVYEESSAGDGTVPLEMARLDGVPTYFIEESHGWLPNNGTVAAAAADLIGTGRTSRLPTEWWPTRRAASQVSDRALAQRAPERRPSDLSLSDRRQLLREFAAPREGASAPAIAMQPARAGAPEVEACGYSHVFEHLVVGRTRQQRIDLRLALGDMAEVDAEAYVLGLFEKVTPSGAARAIDARLGGAIADFTTRRMFSAGVGQVFMMPAGRNTLRADMVLFAGLGPFNRFDDEVQKTVAENVVRTFVRTRVDDFATILFGGGSGQPIATTLQNIIEGFLRGLADADRDRRVRSITLCERDRERYADMKAELYRLASTRLFEDVEVTFEELRVPEPAGGPPVRGGLATWEDPVYLVVREEGERAGVSEYRSSVLGVGSKATVVSGTRRVARSTLDKLLERIGTQAFEPLPRFGAELAELMLDATVKDALESQQGKHLVVVHDTAASLIPWETLFLGASSPALMRGLSRRYMADNLSVARWLEQRKCNPTLDVLLIGNPTGDLPAAETETDRLAALIGRSPAMRVDVLRGADATKRAILSALRSGDHDVVHYAGHAFFDPNVRVRSGILCHGEEVLSAPDLVGIGNLPSLMFFNACEAARIRGRVESGGKSTSVRDRIDANVGLAEAFLRAGLANYVGTYWPVGDVAAGEFAGTFYDALVAGRSIGAALLEGRHAVQATGSIDWADYIHYGSHDFVLKHRDGPGGEIPAPAAPPKVQRAAARRPSRKRRSGAR